MGTPLDYRGAPALAGAPTRCWCAGLLRAPAPARRQSRGRNTSFAHTSSPMSTSSSSLAGPAAAGGRRHRLLDRRGPFSQSEGGWCVERSWRKHNNAGQAAPAAGPQPWAAPRLPEISYRAVRRSLYKVRPPRHGRWAVDHSG